MTNGKRPWHLLDGNPHDARLVDRVHPAGWIAREPRARHDLVVIGGGTAGLVSAMIAAALGARVALVERALLGGDCLVTGCVPSKALLRAARAAADVRDAGRFGVRARVEAVDFTAVMDRLRRVRADIAANDSAERLAASGVDVVFGHARFVAADAIEANGRRLEFSRAILATGARAAVPGTPGIEDAGYLTNETIFNLTTLPRRLVVVGGGPIGCELAQAFARLGSEVGVVQRGARLLPRDDGDASRIAAAALSRDGVRLLLGATALRVDRSGDERRVIVRVADGSTQTLPCDEILVAAGRAPNVEDLGLDAAGVEIGPDGVRVDDRLRTTNRRVFAAGDVASRHQFTHAADAMARIAVQNALLPVGRRASRLVIPWCTYTDPEIAHVGISADEAARDPRVVTITVTLDHVDRAVLDGEDEGFARVHVSKRSGRILGATLAARHAGESIAEIVLAMTQRLSLSAIDGAIHCYPTQGEVLRRAAGQWRRARLRPWMPRIVRRWLDLRG